MDDTTKYVLFGLLILFVIMIPSMIRFCCIERFNKNSYYIQDQYQDHDNEHIKPTYTQA
jgi:hypothetical protein